MKNFYLKILTYIVLITATIITINTYRQYTQTKNFKIINERQSVIIQLPNSEYIEIASRNDHIDEGKNFFVKPFNTNNKIQKNSNLENSIQRTNINTEYIENGKNKRLLKVTPKDPKSINVEIYADTTYQYTDGLKYSIQIDYSNKTNFNIKDGEINYSEKGCYVTIHTKDLQIKQTDNSQSIVLSQKYNLNVKFDINLDIKCN